MAVNDSIRNQNYLLSRDGERLAHAGVLNTCYRQIDYGCYRYLGTALSERDAISWVSGRKIEFSDDQLIGPEIINVSGV